MKKEFCLYINPFSSLYVSTHTLIQFLYISVIFYLFLSIQCSPDYKHACSLEHQHDSHLATITTHLPNLTPTCPTLVCPFICPYACELSEATHRPPCRPPNTRLLTCQLVHLCIRCRLSVHPSDSHIMNGFFSKHQFICLIVSLHIHPSTNTPAHRLILLPIYLSPPPSAHLSIPVLG